MNEIAKEMNEINSFTTSFDNPKELINYFRHGNCKSKRKYKKKYPSLCLKR